MPVVFMRLFVPACLFEKEPSTAFNPVSANAAPNFRNACRCIVMLHAFGQSLDAAMVLFADTEARSAEATSQSLPEMPRSAGRDTRTARS